MFSSLLLIPHLPATTGTSAIVIMMTATCCCLCWCGLPLILITTGILNCLHMHLACFVYIVNTSVVVIVIVVVVGRGQRMLVLLSTSWLMVFSADCELLSLTLDLSSYYFLILDAVVCGFVICEHQIMQHGLWFLCDWGYSGLKLKLLICW